MDSIRARQADYREKNREAIRARSRRYHTENREHVRKLARDYRDRRIEWFRDREQRWREANPEKIKAYQQSERGQAIRRKNRRAHYRRDPVYYKWKALERYGKKRGAKGKATRKQIEARWAMFGGRCWLCGGVATATDHVQPLAKGGSNWPANLRPVCGPCNSRKQDLWPYAKVVACFGG